MKRGTGCPTPVYKQGMTGETMSGKEDKSVNPLWGNIFSGLRKNTVMSVHEILRRNPLFAGLTARELRRVADIIHERKYQAGEFLFEKDQPGAAMFIIKSGIVNIVVPSPDGGRSLELATLVTDDFVGELALLDDSPRSASAVAVETTEALAFFREDLNDLLGTYPVIASKILHELAVIIGQRLKATNEQLFARHGA